jgi:L-alanine-DL-glutamate epimerase-like enolase superfamily enzyme
MKVVEIRGHQVGFVPSPPIGNARTMLQRRDFLLLELVTDNGLAGWGEVFASPHAAAALIKAKLAPSVLGRSPLRYRAVWEQLVAGVGYDRRGVAMMAISAIDMALHELAAKAYGISIAALLGGAVRDRVFAYASAPFIAGNGDPYGHYPGEVERCLARGFRAVKPRCGVSPQQDAAMVERLRKLVGPDVGLMVDINHGYTARAAIAAARAMQDADLLWIEEPIVPDDVAGYAMISKAVPTPIAAGEALGNCAAIRDFLVGGAISIIQPDLTVCGGYSGFLRVAALADAFELPVMPHVFGTIVNQRAALQAASLVTTRRGGGPAPYPYIEVDATQNPLMTLDDMPGLNQDGSMSVPDEPGTGLQLSGEQLAEWRSDLWVCREA